MNNSTGSNNHLRSIDRTYVAIFVTPLVLPLLLLTLLGRACVSVEVMYIVQFVDKSVFFFSYLTCTNQNRLHSRSQ